MLSFRDIRRSFGAVTALDGVTFDVNAGSAHALVGENGAGKSTLMKTLYGMHQPDEGEILVGGEVTRFRTPTAAIAAGIGMVHQHFMLADNLTVLENIVLGAEPTHGVLLDKRAARRKILEISNAYKLDLHPDDMVENLGVGARQRVEICKVLYRGARILILDEPTAVLVPHEVDELFGNLRELKAEGLTVLFISHKLDEVLAVADEITVIRRGETVANVSPKEVTARRLAELMVGSELPSPQTGESTVTDEVALEVSGLSMVKDGRPLLSGIDRGPGLAAHRARLGALPEPGADALLALPYAVFAQLFAFHTSQHYGVTTDDPFPGGTVNRVVQGVTIHPLP